MVPDQEGRKYRLVEAGAGVAANRADGCRVPSRRSGGATRPSGLCRRRQADRLGRERCALIMLGGGGGIGMGGMGPLLLLGLAVAAAFLVVLALRAAGAAILQAVRRSRTEGRGARRGGG